MENISLEECRDVSMLYKMILIRTFENAVAQKKMQREIYGMAHCACGQEAVAVGVCAALRKDDYVVSTHRPHGHALAKGVDAKKIMAEIMGKETGTNRGKGGSMHVMDQDSGMVMSTGIVGSGIPVACGTAFASKYKRERKVTCVFFGDGAANEGVFYECLNISAIWHLPIVFVLEDNGLAVTTNTRETSACSDYATLANAFGIEAKLVDGQDVEVVYNTAIEMVEQIRLSNQPMLIHAKTVRFNEHAEGEYYWEIRKTGYRSLVKLEEDKKLKCPIQCYSIKLIERGIITEAVLERLKEKASIEVQESLKYADRSLEPQKETAFQNVFKENI